MDLKQAAVNAIEQINYRQYELALKQKGINRIAKIGIAFRGKQLEVYSESNPALTPLFEFNFPKPY